MEDASLRNLAPAPRRRPGIRVRDGWFLLIAGFIIVLDQFTKWFIRQELARGDTWADAGVFKVVHITNSGAAFGILQNAGPLLAVTSLIGMVAIFIYLFNPGFAHPFMRVGLALMLGGAVGNLIDRVRSGEVVDFLKVTYWPAFNVADSAITIGVLLLLWTMLREPDKRSTAES
ncbi:MAG: signal peptidase II [Chloroflexi bacterium]|nr:signal peptidase II [Chloroflexota bacterium]